MSTVAAVSVGPGLRAARGAAIAARMGDGFGGLLRGAAAERCPRAIDAIRGLLDR